MGATGQLTPYEIFKNIVKAPVTFYLFGTTTSCNHFAWNIQLVAALVRHTTLQKWMQALNHLLYSTKSGNHKSVVGRWTYSKPSYSSGFQVNLGSFQTWRSHIFVSIFWSTSLWNSFSPTWIFCLCSGSKAVITNNCLDEQIWQKDFLSTV